MKKLLGVLAITATVLSVATTSGNTAPKPNGPCGTRSTTTYTDVVVIVMENHSYSKIIGSTDAPYENSLAAECGVASSYYAITHPSLPNYIAMTAGTTAGITDDKSPSYHKLTNPSIFEQEGSSWRSYEESMPSNCDLSNSGLYAVRHNPGPYFTNARTACSTQDVPVLSSPAFSAAYTFVTPNLCNDMHDCSVTTGDNWLKAFVPKVLGSSEYNNGNLVLFLTWDEGGGSTGTNNVPMIVVGPTVPAGLQVSTTFNHYGLLRASEEILGEPCLANACTATSLRAAFHL